MLFPYQYVSHKLNRMQSFINFIFFEVWCKAPKSGAFRLDLFDGNPDLKEVMTTFYYSDKKNAQFFSGHIERIYGLFAQLSRSDIRKFRKWYRGNNNIKMICANVSAIRLARYTDIPIKHEALTKQLAEFFKGLYDHLDVEVLKMKIGSIDDHYKTFMGENTAGKCPFCGLSDMLGEYHSRREAYDHYLPKTLYPFNSVNFFNLVPACHYCNSSYKTSKDPAFTPKDPARAVHRRKIFYPYAKPGYNIEVKINLNTSDIDRLEPSNIQLSFGPPGLNEEIDTWKDVYGIEERYKAKCCSETDGKYWLTQVLDEWKEDGRLPADYLTSLAKRASKSPFADCNFLRKAFLDACDNVGVFTP